MTHEQHHNVSSLVSDLVTMAEATRRLPEVERELAEMRSASSRDGDTIARLERKLMERSAEIDELRAKLRSVEAERDDAGFRQLEAEDKVVALSNAIESVFPALGEALGTIDGTSRVRVMRMTEVDRQGYLNFIADREYERQIREEDERLRAKEAELAALHSIEHPHEPQSVGSLEGLSVADPTVQSASTSPSIAPSDTAETTANVSQETSTSNRGGNSDSGQSEVPPPFVPPVSSEAQTTVHDGTANVSEHAPNAGRYTGKKYWDYPYYVSEESWVANGGTLEDYHWKPAANA